MAYDYCEAHGYFDWDDSPEGCPHCYREELTTVELVTHDRAPGIRAARDRWGIAQWLEAPATAIPHWHVWRYSSDMMVAMQDAMACAKKGGRWALVCPAPSEAWDSEQVLEEALEDDLSVYEHYLTGE